MVPAAGGPSTLVREEGIEPALRCDRHAPLLPGAARRSHGAGQRHHRQRLRGRPRAFRERPRAGAVARWQVDRLRGALAHLRRRAAAERASDRDRAGHQGVPGGARVARFGLEPPLVRRGHHSLDARRRSLHPRPGEDVRVRPRRRREARRARSDRRPHRLRAAERHAGRDDRPGRRPHRADERAARARGDRARHHRRRAQPHRRHRAGGIDQRAGRGAAHRRRRQDNRPRPDRRPRPRPRREQRHPGRGVLAAGRQPGLRRDHVTRPVERHADGVHQERDAAGRLPARAAAATRPARSSTAPRRPSRRSSRTTRTR